MSFFDDDFYSTKVRVQRSWRPGPMRPGSPFVSIAIIAFLSLLVGVVLTALTIGGRQPTYNQVVRVADQVKPAIVSIIAAIDGPLSEDSTGVVLGSGVIFEKRDGRAHIVTNYHVVESVNGIDVVLSNGEYRKATIVAGDPLSDIAVVEIDASGIKHVAKFGDSDKLKSAETAIAIGNPLGLGYSPTITVGVVSAPKRTIPISLSRSGEADWERDVIQTDAAINQGNSGGALVDIQGRVIGINSMKVANTGVEGMGFAIPINDVKPIIESLLKIKKVKRPFMGVASQSLQSFRGVETLGLPGEVKMGVIVLEVSGPALEAGLLTSDVIVGLDDQLIQSTLELRKYLYNNKSIGDKIKVTYYREGKKETITFVLAESE